MEKVFNDEACNTECPAYARGTCGYIDAATISQPVEEYGLKDRRTCPRFQQFHPEQLED